MERDTKQSVEERKKEGEDLLRSHRENVADAAERESD